MKHNFMKTFSLNAVNTACLCMLFYFSGCNKDEIAPGVSDLCSATLEVKGPDPLIGEICDSTTSGVYEFFANGVNLSDPSNSASWAFTWSVSGDLAMLSLPNAQGLVVQPTAAKGSGTITLTGPADGECKTEEGSFRTLITKQINIIPNQLNIATSPSLNPLCFDAATGVGKGVFTVEDLTVTGLNIPQYDWSVSPDGAATIDTMTPISGLQLNQISIINIKADFTLTVTRVDNKCKGTTASKSFVLSTFPICP